MFDTKPKSKALIFKRADRACLCKKIVILDPSSSTTGLGLAAWTKAVLEIIT
nr:hypothetical protein [Treponema denticola]